MKQGLYDIEVRPGSFQEMALLFREIRDQETQYQSAALSVGEKLEDPGDLLDQLRDRLLPGIERQKERTIEKKAEYIQGLQEVDWSEVLSFDPDEMERIENQQKTEEALGPIASN